MVRVFTSLANDAMRRPHCRRRSIACSFWTVARPHVSFDDEIRRHKRRQRSKALSNIASSVDPVLNVILSGISLFKSWFQTRTKTVWSANAKVEPGFEREGPSTAPQQTGSASRW